MHMLNVKVDTLVHATLMAALVAKELIALKTVFALHILTASGLRGNRDKTRPAIGKLVIDCFGDSTDFLTNTETDA